MGCNFALTFLKMSSFTQYTGLERHQDEQMISFNWTMPLNVEQM